jgi:VanW like protein
MALAPHSSTVSTESAVAQWGAPTRRSAVLFRAKAIVHQARRGIRNLGAGTRRFAAANDLAFSVILGESRTPLWSEHRSAERQYELGKVHNLRGAVRRLDRVVVPAEGLFSFWKQVGRASRGRGFTAGRMLQEGCLVPAVGGGLCQLSNALYDVALQAGCDIVERHAHSRAVPGSAAAAGRDATIAWNYVDLRFRAGQALRIDARVERTELVVRLCGRADDRTITPAKLGFARTSASLDAASPADAARSCATCGETGCFRHEHSPIAVDGVAAFLVDENWPEFQDYVATHHRSTDVLGIPLNGRRWHLPRYCWNTNGFARVGTASYRAIERALAVRRLPMQGAARRMAELAAAERIATRLSRLLTADITKVYVAQSLLPFLWRQGHLGGREVEVLMTRLPMADLHARLDRASALHPERATLGDFRAPDWLVAAEREALADATHIVTAHAELARFFVGKAVRLDWQRPTVAPADRAARRADRIAFPGPTVARKGAYEVREAALALDLEIVPCGSELEGTGFWDGVRTRRPERDGGGDAWLAGVGAVVQPAIVEDRPRHLLAALAAGVPVIATAACGLAEHDLLTIVPENDPQALIAALRQTL